MSAAITAPDPFPRPHEPEAFSLELAVETITGLLNADYPLARRAMALLLLQEDAGIEALVLARDPSSLDAIKACVTHAKGHYQQPLDYVIASRRQEEASAIVCKVYRPGKAMGDTFSEALSRLTIHPVTGVLILLLILYYGFYKLVGSFGAGTLVDLLENHVFKQFLNPLFVAGVDSIVPWQPVRDLLVGEYGILTLGMRYALALILPIVAIFFIVFSVIEDTGYLPRLALLIDRLFKKIGLSGRAVIPMVLGFGCSTMATVVTRTLPTRRERVIATLLLALAVPCSAQLGVILALLQGHGLAFVIWSFVMLTVFLVIGFLAAQVLPGERPSFYMEVPPLRWPKLSNIITKTLSRMWWYCLEVVPLFLLASVLIWLAQLMGWFTALAKVFAWPVKWMGLPPETASVFIFGFFRRDYGAAGLYDLDHTGKLTALQLLVSCVALALFMPCIAQFLMNVKERGWKVGIGISVFIFFFSFAVAALVNTILVAIRVAL